MRQFKPVVILLFFISSIPSFSQTTLFDQQMKVGFEEKQGQYVALDTKLVNLVYYRCPGTCSPLMWGISKFIDQLDLKLGTDYQILTVSFDYTEPIDLGIKKKANYLSTMQNKEAGKYWQFFVSDSVNIEKLTKSVGFEYKFINNNFVHPTGLIAMAADGKITRYLRGIDFLPFDIKITMIEAANGKIGPSINRLLAICYSYDDTGNQFVFNVTRVSGILIIFFALIFFTYLAFHRLKTRKEA